MKFHNCFIATAHNCSQRSEVLASGIHLLHRIPKLVFGTISRDAKAEKLNMQQQQLNGNTIPIRVITG